VDWCGGAPRELFRLETGTGDVTDDDGEPDEGLSPPEAFAILGNETRLGALQALWEADGPMSFAELQREVAPDDTGNFNYHLGKLTGHFVRQMDEGYELRLAGEQVVRAVVAGTITERPNLPAATIDEQCVYCGGDVEMAYDREVISVRCTECDGVVQDDLPSGTYMHYGFPPAGLEGRTREAAVDAAHVLYDSKIAPMMKGVCPECAGRTTRSLSVCEDHAIDDSGRCPDCETRYQVWAVYRCEHCRYSRQSVAWFEALNHPAVVAFYHDHGLEETIPFRKLTDDNASLVRDIDTELLATDPYRLRVTLPVDDEVLAVTMDDDLDVVEFERTTSG
jgi:hypothetical protein